MDPDKTLQELRDLVWKVNYTLDLDLNPVDVEDVDMICQKFTALHDWLCAGGFLPEDWKRKRPQNDV